MQSAQETFNAMLRDEIAPRLRSLGFKGSGQRFYLSSACHWAVLGFQKSAFSDATFVSFTINLTVVGRAEWARGRATWPNLPERPAANTPLTGRMQSAFPGYWQTRIGFLIPGNRDRWWKVEAQAETGDIAEAVVADIREVAIPAMLERIERPDNANRA